MLRDYTKSNRKWTEGIVTERTGPVSYTVKSNDGQVHRRHIDQLHTRKSRHSLSKAVEISSYDQNCTGVTQQTERPEEVNDKEEFFDSVGEGAGCEMQSRPSAPSPPPASASPAPAGTDNTRVRRKAAIRCQEMLKKM
ncbi:hypothetical protein HF086_001930 [Spodoptera exigua]|uniref:Uncharacterized protein n=1 Tax=Spodoptera exigua TaxID=7107 RepID=A0A922MF71_SPOEX|nr:hypothetical protein HF086_001930 [Spodoptera exigua]